MSSGAISPARAPPSMLMLQTVIRCSIVRPRIASPVYSKTWPVPPPMPIRAISARMMSLALTPGDEPAVDAHLVGLRVALEQGLGGEDHLDLAGPDPERQRPERAVGRGVRIAAHDRHPRLGQPELRADDVDDALARVADAVERDPELGAVGLELVDLGERHLVDERQAAVGRRDRVVRGRDGLAGAADADPAGAQPGEGLRAGDLVDEVEIDGQDGGRTRVLGHDVVVPDLVDDGARRGSGHRRWRLPKAWGRSWRGGTPGPSGRAEPAERDSAGVMAEAPPGRGRGSVAEPAAAASGRHDHQTTTPSARSVVRAAWPRARRLTGGTTWALAACTSTASRSAAAAGRPNR